MRRPIPLAVPPTSFQRPPQAGGARAFSPSALALQRDSASSLPSWTAGSPARSACGHKGPLSCPHRSPLGQRQQGSDSAAHAASAPAPSARLWLHRSPLHHGPLFRLRHSCGLSLVQLSVHLITCLVAAPLTGLPPVLSSELLPEAALGHVLSFPGSHSPIRDPRAGDGCLCHSSK